MQMGCSSSKLDDEPIVVRCKERKLLIKQIINYRYGFAMAHERYVQSLGQVGEALKRFAEDEMQLLSSSSATTTPKASASVSTPSEKKSSDAAAHEKSSSTSSLHLHSDSHSHHSYSHSGSSLSSPFHNDDGHDHFGEHDHFHEHNHFNDEHDHFEFSPSPPNARVSYMKSGGGAPSRSYEERPQSPSRVTSWDSYMGGSSYYPYEPPSYSQYDAGPSNSQYGPYGPSNSQYGASSSQYGPSSSQYGPSSSQYGPPNSQYGSSSQYGMDSFFGTPATPPQQPRGMSTPGPSDNADQHVPPPPSPPRTNTWEIFNPFMTMDFSYPSRYMTRSSGASDGSSGDSNKIREEEGIPDLEDENQGEGTKSTRSKEERSSVDKGHPTAEGPFETTDRSVNPPSPEKATTAEEPAPSKSQEVNGGIQETDEQNADALKADKSSMENIVASGDGGIHLEIHHNRNIREVVDEIVRQFKRAQDAGKHVSKVIEPHKAPYRPKFSIFKAVISTKVFSAFTWNRGKSSKTPPSKDGHSRKSKSHADEFMLDDDSITGESHSSTLDKIYFWEKKLYEEVKASEKMRIEFQRIQRQMTHRAAKWEDSKKMDEKGIAIKNLETKINVAYQVVDSISKEIHKLRDEELEPQIVELIEGFTKMCKEMFDSHQLQAKAISEAKFVRHLSANGVLSESYQSATVQLDLELQNWRACFENWYGAQRAYVQTLNGWLFKWVFYEQEDTADGVMPYSPRRLGTPPIFIICNDWYQALRSLPVGVVIDSISFFEEHIKKACMEQDKEQNQRVMAENMKRNLERREQNLQRLQDENIITDKKIDLDTGQTEMSLDSFRKLVEQANADYHKVMQDTHNLTLENLHSGLKDVFSKLTEFTAAFLQMYEEVMKHSGKENLSTGNGDISHASNNND